MREKLANVLWGLVLIAIGILVGGKVAGFWEFSVFFPGWWSLFLIVPCFLGMIKNGPGPVNTILLLCGVLILLVQNGVVDGSMAQKLMLPAIFFILGLFFLVGSVCRGARRQYKGTKEYTATFAGNVVRLPQDERFQGCVADAVFGGLELDLRDAVIEDGAVIEASGIFGGVDIKVPEGINVKLRRTVLFGGAKSGRARSMQTGVPVLYVNATCMFGGVDIK